MPEGDGTGPSGQGPGTGRGMGRGRRDTGSGRNELNSGFISQKSTLGGTLFAFASMLFGNWLDKKISQKKVKDKNKQAKPSE